MTEPARSPAAGAGPLGTRRGSGALRDVGASAVPDQVADLSEQLESCLHELRGAQREVEEYAAYCARKDLRVDGPVIARLIDAAQHAGLRIIRQRSVLLGPDGDEAADLLGPSEQVLRFGLATLGYVRHAMEWAAKSYGQSQTVQFFGTQSAGWPTMNYDRNGTYPSVTRVERQLLELLGLSPEEFVVAGTSSGMAAFTVIEAFLLRDRLVPGDTVLLAPYIYYESAQQLTALPHLRTERASGYAVEEIIDDVVRLRPRCVFVDPLANNVRQRMFDLPELFRRLREVVTEQLTVVVDGTMIGAALPAELLTGDDRLEILYYESCTKYLQLGMDFSLGGLVAYPKPLFERFDMLRRNIGAAMHRHSADLFPRYSPELHRRRMRRIWSNAERLAGLLDGDPRVRDAGAVHHPALPTHPDNGIARTLPYGSGIVTFRFHEGDRNNWNQLNTVVDEILARARETGVQATKGVSFGYSAPRVWAQDVGTTEVERKFVAATDDEPLFLRLYVGDRAHQLESFAEAIAKALVG